MLSDKFGILPSLYSGIVTSGEVGFDRLASLASSPSLADSSGRGPTLLCFGNGVDDEEYVRESGWLPGDEERCQYCVARGTFAVFPSSKAGGRGGGEKGKEKGRGKGGGGRGGEGEGEGEGEGGAYPFERPKRNPDEAQGQEGEDAGDKP